MDGTVLWFADGGSTEVAFALSSEDAWKFTVDLVHSLIIRRSVSHFCTSICV
jgi:hypothetical protein